MHVDLNVETLNQLLEFDEELEDEVFSQIFIVICDNEVKLVHLHIEDVICYKQLLKINDLLDDLGVWTFIGRTLNDGQFKTI